jgi:hypothetical protein
MNISLQDCNNSVNLLGTEDLLIKLESNDKLLLLDKKE